jgi:hypothetical protein
MASGSGSVVTVKSPLQFDPDKAIQTILYIAGKLGRDADLYKVLKTAYFADRRHLERYGRFIFGDTYRRIDYGPVPRQVYAMIGHLRQGKAWAPGPPQAEGMLRVERTRKRPVIVPLQEPDLDWFSRSDLECLDEAIQECRPLTFDQLKDRGHDDAACRQTPLDGDMTIESIASTLPNSKELLRYLRSQCSG